MTPTSTGLSTTDVPTDHQPGLTPGLTVEDAVRIAAALEASLAPATRILYAHLWRVWARWCATRGLEPLPADPAALAAYLVERAAECTAVVTLDVACVAIRHVHLQHGLANPAETELVRQVRLGLRRTYGTAPRRLARPLTTAEIRQILAAIDTSVPICVRDPWRRSGPRTRRHRRPRAVVARPRPALRLGQRNPGDSPVRRLSVWDRMRAWC